MGIESPFPSEFDLSQYTAPTASISHVDSLGQMPLFAVPGPAATLDNLADWVRRQAAGGPLVRLEEWAGLDLDPFDRFETWVHLLRRATSAVPGRSGAPGVSLYHEFKVISAAVHAALVNPRGLEDGFTLISGDFPGVQRIIYTITSDRATKGVRGRSFFLQLLGECVVRRLLHDLGELPVTNALIAAGGNFVLLTPAWIDEEAVPDRARAITSQVNEALLDQFSGDLLLATACESIKHNELLDANAFGEDFRRLKASEGREKRQPLAEVALASDDGWKKVFDRQGQGGLEVCKTCQREPRDVQERRDARSRGRDWICPTCRMFEDLAQSLAKTPDPILLIEHNVAPDLLPVYARTLQAISGWTCSVLGRVPDDSQADAVVLRLNEVDFDPQWEDGFRLLAVHTPKVGPIDRDWIQKHYDDILPDDREDWPNPGDIRDFEMLACARAIDHLGRTGNYAAPSFARLGVLRMDVDGLGRFFSETLGSAALPLRLAASDALSLFFDGYLGQLCRSLEEEKQRPESIYLLYGGGDDLFIVGEWDLLPYLAQRIRDEFVAYAGPVFGISAGIILVTEKYPFYRAAELADHALETAKNYCILVGKEARTKDAICFLDTVLPWKAGEAWDTVRSEHAHLLKVARSVERGAITGHIFRIYTRWQKDQQGDSASRVYFGPYMWLAAYQMSRLADQYPDVQDDIRHFQEFLLQPETIALSGVTARWAELERRALAGLHEPGEE
jgi:CRISPR-associated protein Csm1